MLTFEPIQSKLFSGGQDGVINMFDVRGGRISDKKAIIDISKHSLKPRIRSLDVYNYDILLGTGAS